MKTTLKIVPIFSLLCGCASYGLVAMSQSLATETDSELTETASPEVTTLPVIEYDFSDDLREEIGKNHMAVAVYDLTNDRLYSAGSTDPFATASTIKVSFVMHLMSEKQLTDYERKLAYYAIVYSDNDCATTLYKLGQQYSTLQSYFDKLGMNDTTHNLEAWGYSTTTPQDQIRLLKELYLERTTISDEDAEYLIELMSEVIDEQAWGLGYEGNDYEFELKNGWVQDEDWYVNSIGHVKDSDHDYLIAIYSDRNETMESGVAHIEALARLVNRKLAFYED